MARKRKSVNFKPNHAYIDKTVDFYLKSGGKITKVELTKNSFFDFISIRESLSAADEFLLGSHG